MDTRSLEKDFYVTHRIIDPRLDQGQKIHAFLFDRAKRLVGQKIDLEKNGIRFLLSDVASPNAFFVPVITVTQRQADDAYSDTYYANTPLNVPAICVTKGVIDLIENVDQLDYILGHELTHFLLELRGREGNSKGEELLADLHALDLVYDAGSDPRQALVLHDKIHERARKLRDNNAREDHSKDVSAIHWSEVFDVHIGAENRRTALEASLTRISHLIDSRKPTPIDKSIFVASYRDPVVDYLTARHYNEQKPHGKLRLLIDSLEALSSPSVSAQTYYDARLKELEAKAAIARAQEDGIAYRKFQDEMNEIRLIQDGGYAAYYNGPVMERKYQQEITDLAECVIEQANGRWIVTKRPKLQLANLDHYVMDKAFRLITANGYPPEDAPNYFDATAMMYTYFSALFQNHATRAPRKPRKNGRPYRKPLINAATDAAKNAILQARSYQELVNAIATHDKLIQMNKDIRQAYYAGIRNEDKLRHISFTRPVYYERPRKDTFYPEPKIGQKVAWNNLVEIGRSSEEARVYVTAFLKKHGISDFRISHNMPYVRVLHRDDFEIDTAGVIRKVGQRYITDFAVHREAVLESYARIKDYFINEPAQFDAACKSALALTSDDYKVGKQVPGEAPSSLAERTLLAFSRLFNTIPVEGGDEVQKREEESVLFYIENSFFHNTPLPCWSYEVGILADSPLFRFDNPVFKTFFDPDYKQRLETNKAALREKMFATALQMIDNAADILDEATHQLKQVDQRKTQMSNTKQTALSFEGDEIDRITLELNEKAQTARSVLIHFTAPVISRNQSSYYINNLTRAQKETLANHIIRDEKKRFARLFEDRVYTAFCDHLHAFSDQVDRLITGDLTTTPLMETIANSLGYKKITSADDFGEILKKEDDGFASNNVYPWHLRTLDLMRLLQRSPRIDLLAMARTIINGELSVPTTLYGIQEHMNYEAFRSYVRLIQNSPLSDYLAKAIAYKANYRSLSLSDSFKTASYLIILKCRLSATFTRNLKQDDTLYRRIPGKDRRRFNKRRYQKFIDVIDDNVRILLQRAVRQTLALPDKMEKIETLYVFFSSERVTDAMASSQLALLDKGKGKHTTTKWIESLSADPAFWPQAPDDHIKAYLLASSTFLDDRRLKDSILGYILDKIERLPAGDRKTTCLSTMLNKELRATDPDLRNRLFTLYADDVRARLGMDDGTDAYREKLKTALNLIETPMHDVRQGRTNLLAGRVSDADKYVLLRRVSDAVLTQEASSAMVKGGAYLHLSNEKLAESYFYGVGIDYLAREMDQKPKTAHRFLQFLNGKGELDDCAACYADLCRSIFDKPMDDLTANEGLLLQHTKPADLKTIYANFWAAPLEVRTVIVARILKSACRTPEDGATDERHSWERVFDVVMDTLIPARETSVESRYARDMMHSYIKARSDYEREMILSAMMVANRNIGDDAGNVGKALKLFLENMGPAEIKVGQAVASHPLTPDSIRVELQQLKNQADVPARWTLYEWIRDAKIPESLWKGQHLGEVRGSASYFTTVDLGDDSVLRLLRPEAREKATKGFHVIDAMIADLKTKDQTSDLDYRTLTTSVSEMVQQALRMAPIETDLSIGLKQDAIAREIYDGAELASGDEVFKLKLMEWKAHGPDWALLERARGPVFNELPETTEAERALKRNFAKAYILFEARNILSGRRFDHDRHGAQLCVDADTHVVGVFDTGAIRLHEPTREDQKNLGHILYDAFQKTETNGASETMAVIGAALDDKIKALHQSGQDTHYLIEVKKGFLALGDFFKVLKDEDCKTLVQDIDLFSHIGQPVREAFVGRMSFMERTKFKLYLKGKSWFGRDCKTAQIKQTTAEMTRSTDVYTASPDVKPKSSWFEQILSPMANDNQTTKKNDRPQKLCIQRSCAQTVGR